MASSFLDNYEAPGFRQPKKRSYWLLIVGILAVALVTYFIVTPSSSPVTSNQEVTDVPEVSNDIQPATEITTTPEVSVAVDSDAPPINTKCDVVAGIVPGSLILDGNKVAVTFKNNGKKVISGSYFEVSDEAHKVYVQNEDVIQPGDAVTYSLNLDDLALELGAEVRSFVILPVQDNRACTNQQMIVFQDRATNIGNFPDAG